MALQYRRGSASIEEAATRKGGAGFRPFIPQIQWREDGESKYVLVLTDIDEVAELLLHAFIPVGTGEKANGDTFTRYEDFLSRKMAAIGEDYDDLEERLQREPKIRHMGVMVELEPIMEGGTKRLKGFVVKTETFTRKTDDGEIEMITPVIGLCTQSAQLMWGPLNNLNHQVGALVEVPLLITRHGTKTNTRYDIVNFLEKPVDLSPIIDYMEGISYIGDDLAEVIRVVDAEENPVGQAQAVASYLLNKRIDELADPARYEEFVGPLELDDMPKNPWGRKQSAKNDRPSRSARPARRSPRENSDPEPEPEPAPEAKPSKNERFQALKTRVEARG